MQYSLRLIIVFLLAIASPSLSHAQGLAGDWTARGPGIGGGPSSCLMRLGSDGHANSWCLSGLSAISTWRQRGNAAIDMLDGMGNKVGTTGGTSNFQLGKSGGQRIWMSKSDRCGIVASGADICLDSSDYGPPKGGAGDVTTISGLSLWETYSTQSTRLARIKPNSCFAVHNCQQTDYGAIWCQANYDGKSGWVTKFFVDDDQMWATFLNGCQ